MFSFFNRFITFDKSEFVTSSLFVDLIVCISCKGSYVLCIGVCVIEEVLMADICLTFLADLILGSLCCKFEIDPRVSGCS